MVQDAVQNGGGNGDIGKNLIPLGKGLVGGENSRCLLVASGNELKKQICPLNVHKKIADFVNDKHPVLGQNFESFRNLQFIASAFGTSYGH